MQLPSAHGRMWLVTMYVSRTKAVTARQAARYVQGLRTYVQGFTLKACRHVLRRVTSPGHPWRLMAPLLVLRRKFT